MNRRAFGVGLGALLAAPLAAEAQPAKGTYVIGILSMAAGPSPIYGPASSTRFATSAGSRAVI